MCRACACSEAGRRADAARGAVCGAARGGKADGTGRAVAHLGDEVADVWLSLLRVYVEGRSMHSL